MNWYEKVDRYYKLNIYDKGDVWDFVSYKKITKEDYESITGDPYPELRPEKEV